MFTFYCFSFPPDRPTANRETADGVTGRACRAGLMDLTGGLTGGLVSHFLNMQGCALKLLSQMGYESHILSTD